MSLPEGVKSLTVYEFV